MLKWMKSLMGVGYDETEVLDSPPSIPSQYVERTLEEHDPDLALQERVIRAQRQTDYYQETPVLPRSVITTIQEHGRQVGQAAVFTDAATEVRKVQASRSEFADFLVLPPQPKSKALTMAEELERDRQVRRQIARDMASIVPVLRKPPVTA